MEVLNRCDDQQRKAIVDFDRELIKRKTLNQAVMILQDDFEFSFNDIKRFKKKMKRLERG